MRNEIEDHQGGGPQGRGKKQIRIRLRSPMMGGGAFFLLLVSLGWAEDPAGTAFGTVEWKGLFQGVEQAAVKLTEPRPVRAQVLRVRLDTPGLSMVATPDNGDAPGETTGQRTTTFLKTQGCQAAINAAPFDAVSSLEGKPLNISGLQISGGKVVSPDNGSPALVFLNNGEARIRKQPFPGTDIKEAVSGFQVVLWQGKTVATDLKLHPRTGAGVSADGRTLWLLVVDGRQVGTSEGCTTAEMADWLRAMGADSGINLDGGGTSTMVVAGKDGQPVVLNRPIHAGIPGMERPAASHLGVRAPALAAPEPGR